MSGTLADTSCWSSQRPGYGPGFEPGSSRLRVDNHFASDRERSKVRTVFLALCRLSYPYQGSLKIPTFDRLSRQGLAAVPIPLQLGSACADEDLCLSILQGSKGLVA